MRKLVIKMTPQRIICFFTYLVLKFLVELKKYILAIFNVNYKSISFLPAGQ